MTVEVQDMIFDDIERKARRILSDTDEPYRWGSSELREHLQTGIHALHAIRPETRYVNGLLTDFVAVPDVEAEVQDFPIDMRYEEALVYFVVHMCYLDDDSDTVNQQLAELYIQKFNTKAQI